MNEVNDRLSLAGKLVANAVAYEMLGEEQLPALLREAAACISVRPGYVLVQRAPLMDMLEEGWDAMDQEGNGDFFNPEDLAPAWAAMLDWCERNPGAEP